MYREKENFGELILFFGLNRKNKVLQQNISAKINFIKLNQFTSVSGSLEPVSVVLSR